MTNLRVVNAPPITVCRQCNKKDTIVVMIEGRNMNGPEQCTNCGLKDNPRMTLTQYKEWRLIQVLKGKPL